MNSLKRGRGYGNGEVTRLCYFGILQNCNINHKRYVHRKTIAFYLFPLIVNFPPMFLTQLPHDLQTEIANLGGGKKEELPPPCQQVPFHFSSLCFKFTSKDAIA